MTKDSQLTRLSSAIHGLRSVFESTNIGTPESRCLQEAIVLVDRAFYSIRAQSDNEPAPETKREGSASTWPAPAKHHYELCVIEHICDTCKYDSVEPEPEYCLGCTNNNCRWEPAPAREDDDVLRRAE